ncbi:YbbR-like domain-containing protein [Rufibacter roseus]|uniref:YbbR-like domain-containing protein n=1 Tax=Rufibacter roseus TaxID=1567108 RepID=A0ABW2DJD5_9BACT|nr:hypothetical protein [Rufibacter roseus]
MLRPFSPKQKKYWRVVLLCFLTAGTFWLLNALNKNYTTVVSYPIKFVFDQEQLVPVKPLPEEVTISVTGKGWKLLRNNLKFQVQPAELTIRGLPFVKRLPGSALRPAISNVLDGLNLNFVVTDTVSFDFDHLVSRKVPLGIDTTLVKTEAGFVFDGQVQIQPDSVTFTGPEQIINQFPNPFLLPAPTKILRSSFKGSLPVAHDYTSLVKADVKDAEVTFGVVQLEKQEVVVQPTLQNFPPGYVLRLINGPVKIQYSYLPRQKGSIQSEQFKVALDYQKFNPADSTIVPTLLQKPALTRQVTVQPARVQVSLIPQ